LADGLTDKSLFTYARALKAFEITNNRRMPPAELEASFAQWWNTAKPLLPSDADFDEWRFIFEDTFAKTHAALGANSLQEAIRRSESSPMPIQVKRYASPKLQRMVAVCYHLQLLQGSSPFFLGVRAAAKILGIKNLHQANAILGGFVRDGILIESEKGIPGGRRATRYRFELTEHAGPAACAARAQSAQKVNIEMGLREGRGASTPFSEIPDDKVLAAFFIGFAEPNRGIKGIPEVWWRGWVASRINANRWPKDWNAAARQAFLADFADGHPKATGIRNTNKHAGNGRSLPQARYEMSRELAEVRQRLDGYDKSHMQLPADDVAREKELEAAIEQLGQ
jgi:hypothetical protein